MDKMKKKESMFFMTWKRLAKNKLAVAGLIVLIITALLAVLAPIAAPYGYEEQDLFNTLAGPSREHWLGTDNLGRDMLSRLIYGGRNSLTLGLISVALAAALGVVLGAVSGYYGGKVDMVIMRLLDVLQAVPAILLAIAISATLGPGYMNCILALTISQIPGFTRMTRASCLNVQGMEYVEAARSINARERRIIFKHVLPNAISPIIVQATMSVATAILTSASLSFIGLGVQPPQAEWGAMLSAGRSYIRSNPHVIIYPGITIMIVVLSLNLLGDGLRDALDPRLKN
ncbi:ABC transporter permease [Hungatella hathewayi]|uniref:ABC transporter permease n=1 Tax=Hungatella hathewayi TaxID=154046 RepID=UPI0035671943